MPLKDLLDLLEKLEGRVNSYWNFYSVVVFAAAGWLVTKDKALEPQAAIFIGIGMSAFFLVNLSVIHFAERRITAVEDEVRLLAQAPMAASSPLFLQHLRSLSIPRRSIYTIIFHLIIDFSLLALLYAKGA